MRWEETKSFFAPCLPEKVTAEMERLQSGELREIRVRAERGTVLRTGERAIFIDWKPSGREMAALCEALSDHSLYAREEETGQGFVTLRGGHRMGLCGRVVKREGRLHMREIGEICVRVACEWPDCAKPLAPLLRGKDGPCSMLVFGPPGSGKTTMLRDLSRMLASGEDARQVAVMDERGELAACVDGVPQLNVGECADVLDGCPKAQAAAWLLRSMSPEALVTDELSGEEEALAMQEAIFSGVAVLASAHARSLNELASRPEWAAILARRCFQWYVALDRAGGGRILTVYDRCGSQVKDW